MEKLNEIKKLDEVTINRIAAGEVIQRPANALKELIENSLDAKATNIDIVVKEGGFRMLQIQDNGIGIQKEDFRILCERFTTSKLREFEDLQTITTYGFRGEALASISHVAHLTITSKTSEQLCAYRGEYVDGKLKESPKPIAGNQGTTIVVEDLFFNMTIRRKALKNPHEEFQKICDVVSKYAIHNSLVGFSLKKYGESVVIKTQPNSSCEENIRLIYGSSISKELLQFKLENDIPKFKAYGFLTNPNYSNKKFTFLLFINHRLVDSSGLKKSLDQLYSVYLPKHCHPFIYLSLELDPTTVDVNVHPTKHEVYFLNEDQIITSICTNIETLLVKSNNSRTFVAQAKLPTKLHVEPLPLKDKTIYPKDLVRTDSSSQKLQKFFGAPIKKSSSMEKKEVDLQFKQDFELNQEDENKLDDFIKNHEGKNRQYSEPGLTKSQISKITRVDTQLSSVLKLRKEIEDNSQKHLRELFAQHVFVGAISPTQALIQHSTKLYLCNTTALMKQLFYQLILYNFENLDYITYSSDLPIKELARLALDLKAVGWQPEDGDKDKLADRVTEILTEKAEMLDEYFSLKIVNGNLKSIPLLLENFCPENAFLPIYILRLATEVDWEREEQCFHTFAKETASFYSVIDKDMRFGNNDWKWGIEHVFYRAIKEFYIPPRGLCESGAVLEIADLPNLYKVFERC